MYSDTSCSTDQLLATFGSSRSHFGSRLESKVDFLPARPRLGWGALLSFRAISSEELPAVLTKLTTTRLADAAPKPKPSGAKDSESRQDGDTAWIIAEGFAKESS